ncbi:MAG: FAD-dependent monooxygenase [Steroidobacteraceae bacterium]
MNSSASFDVVIVGGGPVGAVLGALLRQGPAAYRVLILERELPDWTAPANAADLRVFALSRASERILRAVGAWNSLQASSSTLCTYERMHVWPRDVEPRGEGSLTFDAAELGEPDLGAIVGNDALQRAGLKAFIDVGGEARSAVVHDVLFSDRFATLSTSIGEITTKLVIGADGGRSVVRHAANFGVEAQDYGQLAIVANVASERSHESTAWQRFLGDGTLALLPLASGQSSIVWSLPRDRAERLLAAEVATFDAELTTASAGVLGALSLASERRSFPLRRVSAPHYVRERCALVGDAAHIVHPLAGQGVNLGLLDAAALAEELAEASREREDPGAMRVLRRYERWRKSDNEVMSLAMDLLNRFLAFGGEGLEHGLQRGLGFVGRSAVLRRPFAERALGLAGDLPAIARRG